MGSQRYNEIVNAVRGVVCSQDDGLVLPLVLLGVAVGAVLADLRQLQATQRLLLLEQVAQRGAHADERGHRREPLHDPAGMAQTARFTSDRRNVQFTKSKRKGRSEAQSKDNSKKLKIVQSYMLILKV